MDIKDIGGIDEYKKLMSAVVDEPPKDAAPAEPATVDPLATHDMLTVLVCGVTSWTADDPINKETLGDLVPDDAEFLARQILGMNPNAAKAEADRKNAE